MVGHGGSSAGSYLADPTSPIPSCCASIVVTGTLRVKKSVGISFRFIVKHFDNKVTRAVGKPEFQIPKNVLDLVYSQSLCW